MISSPPKVCCIVASSNKWSAISTNLAVDDTVQQLAHATSFSEGSTLGASCASLFHQCGELKLEDRQLLLLMSPYRYYDSSTQVRRMGQRTHCELTQPAIRSMAVVPAYLSSSISPRQMAAFGWESFFWPPALCQVSPPWRAAGSCGRVAAVRGRRPPVGAAGVSRARISATAGDG